MAKSLITSEEELQLVANDFLKYKRSLENKTKMISKKKSKKNK